jgi:hypothetical protein
MRIDVLRILCIIFFVIMVVAVKPAVVMATSDTMYAKDDDENETGDIAIITDSGGPYIVLRADDQGTAQNTDSAISDSSAGILIVDDGDASTSSPST